MLNKWFKRKSVPEKQGNSGQSQVGNHRFIKIFQLELTNMEDTPTYDLKNQLTIGSEIGNIIIADSTVSPRHATFILQEEVVSVIDHGSISGTRVSGKKIAAGKYIILNDSDIVSVGDLEVRLLAGTVAVPLEVIPDIPQEDSDEADEDIPEIPEIPQIPVTHQTVDKNIRLVPEVKTFAANALIRVLAVFGDFVTSYILLVLFFPFDEFRNFIAAIPNFLGSFVQIDMNAFWSGLLLDYGFMGRMAQDAFNFFSSTLHLGPLLIVFALNRLFGTLLFGVSLSELALGVRSSGNKTWARIGGGLRVLLGFFTWPFIIFDLPSVVSKRTFKEITTYTSISTPSKILAGLGIVIYLPLIIGAALIAPVFQGFEFKGPILVNDSIDKRVVAKTITIENSENKPLELNDRSQKLKFEISYDPGLLAIIPNFNFRGAKNKLQLKNSLIFYQRELKRSVELELVKKFDLKQLLAIAMKGNVFLFDRYPEIYNFVYSSEDVNPNYKTSNDVNAQAAFANDFIQFTTAAFSLSVNNVWSIMKEETYLLKGLVDYRSSFLSLIEYKDFDQVGFIKLGNVYFMKISFIKQKPFDLIIPLVKGDGRIFKVTYDKSENLEEVASKFYKYNLLNTNWIPDNIVMVKEMMSVLDVYDLFSNEDFKEKLAGVDRAQALYAYYFETLGSVLNRGDSIEIDLWKKNLEKIFKLIETIPLKNEVSGEDPRTKLLHNFRDLLDAFENKNLEYFGLSRSSSV